MSTPDYPEAFQGSEPDTWTRRADAPIPQVLTAAWIAEARRQSDAEAWGGRGPLTYAEWVAEGRQEASDEAERQAEYEAEYAEPEWDDADSAAYHEREPEAGQ